MNWFWYTNLLAAVVWALWWFRGANQGFCFHQFFPNRNRYMTGALTCSKCGRVLYPEKMRFVRFYRKWGRIHQENQDDHQ